ncbi:trans-sialidase, putative, partial [Trypanosoma cruzi marinkellei]
RVTVSNVLLYNRALNDEKLKTLMKRKAAAAAARKVPVPEVATQTAIVGEPSLQPVNGPVVTNEAQQEATSSPQSQHPPAQKSERKGGPANSKHTSTDVIDPSTSADLGKAEKEANGGSVLAPASSPTPSVDTREAPATEMPVSGENSEGGQEHFSSNAASPLMEQVGKADGDIPRNDNTDDLESVSNEPPTANTHTHTDVGTNSGPDSFSSTDMTPAGDALGGADAAPTPSSTASGETRNPSEYNATIPSSTDILLEYGPYGDLSAMGLFADSTVQGCVSRVLLLLLLGLWGTAVLC